MSQAGESTVIRFYLPRLIRLAERNLSAPLRKKIDGEDISASVLRSVIRKSRNGLMVIEESEDFWKQLVVITLTKFARRLAIGPQQNAVLRRKLNLVKTVCS